MSKHTLCKPPFQNPDNQKIADDFIFSEQFKSNMVSFVNQQQIRIIINGENYDFDIMKKIGSGAFGTVKKIVDKKHKIVFAVKYTLSQEEKNIAEELNKTNCNALRMKMIGKNENKYVYVMELADGDLIHWYKKKQNISIKNKLEIVEEIRKQIVCIFSYNNEFVYSDLKMENILYKCEQNKERFIIGDLGSAVPIFNEYITTYPAWELRYNRALYNKKMKVATLAWQIGILLLLLIDPNDDPLLDRLYALHKETPEFIFKVIAKINSYYGSNLGNYLHPDINKRLSVFDSIQTGSDSPNFNLFQSPKQSPKQNFPKLSEISLKKLTVVQLKSLAVKLGCKGKFKNKIELIQMIINCKPKSNHKTPPIPQPIPQVSPPKKSPKLSENSLKKLTVVQLKSLAVKLGCKGKFKNKGELILVIMNCVKKASHKTPPVSQPSVLKPIQPSVLKPVQPSVSKKSPLLGLLSNIGNSCYLDSVLLSLLTVQNEFVDSHILYAQLKNRPVSRLDCIPENTPKLPEIDLNNRQQVQNELIKITNSIRENRDVKRCTSLRKILERCPHPEDFYDNQPKDAGEFLGYILNIFDTNVAVKRFSLWGTNNLDADVSQLPPPITTNIDDKASIVHTIYHRQLLDLPNNTPTNSLLTTMEDSGELSDDNLYQGKYKRRIQLQTVVESPYLVINLQRNNPYGYETIKTKIVPSATIELQNKSLSLSAVVIHRGSRSGGHYTAYLKLGQVWYYYNDLGPSIKRVGTYKNLLSYDPSPIKYGTLHFYS